MKKMKWWKKVLIGVGAIIIGLLLIGILNIDKGRAITESKRAAAATATTQAPATATEAPTTTTTTATSTSTAVAPTTTTSVAAAAPAVVVNLDEATTSPKSVVEAVMQCWEAKDWKTMLELTQPTWRVKEANPHQSLEALWGIKTLKSWEIVSEKNNSVKGLIAQAQVETKATYDLLDNGEVKTVILHINVIKEDGRWGFNPISAMRED